MLSQFQFARIPISIRGLGFVFRQSKAKHILQFFCLLQFDFNSGFLTNGFESKLTIPKASLHSRLQLQELIATSEGP